MHDNYSKWDKRLFRQARLDMAVAVNFSISGIYGVLGVYWVIIKLRGTGPTKRQLAIHAGSFLDLHSLS